MSLYILSRRLHILPCGAASQVQKLFQGTGRNTSYDIKARCGYTSWPITRRHYQISPRSLNRVESCRPLYETRRHYASDVVLEKKSRKSLVYLTSLVFGTVGCLYFAAPLYYGAMRRHETVEENIAQDSNASTREVVVRFSADVADGMPWKCVPTQREVSVKPGESASAIYSAENQSSTPIVVGFTYKISPMKAAAYFKCVSLDEQRLLPGEHVDMPVFFYIDPKFLTDPRMDDINDLVELQEFSDWSQRIIPTFLTNQMSFKFSAQLALQEVRNSSDTRDITSSDSEEESKGERGKHITLSCTAMTSSKL